MKYPRWKLIKLVEVEIKEVNTLPEARALASDLGMVEGEYKIVESD